MRISESILHSYKEKHDASKAYKYNNNIIAFNVLSALPNIHLRDEFISCTLSVKQNSTHVIPKLQACVFEKQCSAQQMISPPSPVISPSPRCQNVDESCIYSICHGLISIVNKTGGNHGALVGNGGCPSTLTLTKWTLPSRQDKRL